MPRGVPQTVYTAIADKAAIKASEENDLIAQRVNAEQHVASASPVSAIESMEEDIQSNEVSNVDLKPSLKDKTDPNYPPIVTCDQSLKVLNDDGPPRKRSRPDCATNVPHRTTHQKHLDLAPIYTCYSKPHSGKAPNQYGRSLYNPSGKMSNKSNHSNLSKSNLSKHRSMQNKHGSVTKHCGQVTIPHHQVRSGIKSPTDPHIAGSQALCIQTQVDGHTMKSQTPSFQANYAQPNVQNVGADESNTDIKLNIGNTILESPTMQLLTQTPTSQIVSSPSHIEDNPIVATPNLNSSTMSVTMHTSTPKVQAASGKACHFIIKKKSDNSTDNQQMGQKIQVTNKQIISKQDIKVLQNRQVVISPSNNNPQKILNSSGKLITTKIVQHIPQKSQAQMNANILQQPVTNTMGLDKVIIMPKAPTSLQSSNIQRSLSNTPYKNLYISTHSAIMSPVINPSMTPVMIPVMNPIMTTVINPIMNTVINPVVNTINPMLNPNQTNEASNLGSKVSDVDVLSKSVILGNSDVKLQTKTFLFNSKSGKKMVVLPAKQTSVMGQSVPLLMKGVAGKPTTMKLVPVSGQSINSPSKSSNITVVSKTTNVTTSGKNVTKDSVTGVKINSSNDSSLPKVLKNISIAPRPSIQSIKQTASKGNIIVVQKSNTMSKNPISFSKSGIDANKHISNVSLSEASQMSITPEVAISEASHDETASQGESSSVVVSEMIEQTDRPLTEEFMDEGGDESMTQSSTDIKSEHSLMTEETVGLFPSQVTEEECNADSMESTADSLIETAHIDDPAKSNDSFAEERDIHKMTTVDSKILSDPEANMQNFSNWEVELAEKQNTSDKTDEINLELEMSTDSETDDFAVSSQERSKQKEILHEDGSQDAEQDDTNEMFVQHSSISQARRTLLSQLQDDGSSSNDSPFVLTKNLDAARLELLETSQTSSSAME
ncbi:uncharacterized protein LOC143921393 isoform X2 [Arctopsyche grandis]